MTKEFKKRLEKILKKENEYVCSVNLTIEELYQLNDKYGYTFEKTVFEVPHFLVEGSYVKDGVVIRKER